MKPKIVVIGLGNILLGDEGLGVCAVRQLREAEFPGRVDFYDGGTRGLLLLPFIEEASHLLVLDAVQSDEPPGTIVEITGKALLSAKSPLKFSAHDIALPDLLTLCVLRRGGPGPSLHFLGMIPGSMELSTELSGPVLRSLPELLRRARGVLDEWIAETECPETGETHVSGSSR